MPEDFTHPEMDQLATNVDLRLDIIKKKIDQYFADLEKAAKGNKPLPLPEQSED